MRVDKEEVALEIRDEDGRSSRLKRGKTAAFEAMMLCMKRRTRKGMSEIDGRGRLLILYSNKGHDNRVTERS